LKFIAIGPPFLGSSKTLKQAIGGDERYMKKILNVDIGLNYNTQMALI
jgi:hypothetical protein